MRSVYIISDNIITSLGFTTAENMQRMKAGETGIKHWEEDKLSPSAFWASRVDNADLQNRFADFGKAEEYTRFEQLVICSAMDALGNATVDPKDERTLFILSSTKGSIDLLNTNSKLPSYAKRIFLWQTAELIKQFFKMPVDPFVVSNACISGLLAIMAGARLIATGEYENVIVTGADLVSEFVLSGFNSFLSLGNGPCKPFDKNRDGLSLGEGAGTVILSSKPSGIKSAGNIQVGFGFSSNDANHISGPSRTGEGLYLAIRKTAEKNNSVIDYISAHGTATPFNDEMESIAITRAGLQNVPVNSFKGYWGHTLGAAGVIESIAGAYCLKNNLLLETLGYTEPGTTNPIAVINKTRETRLRTCLKIASGFGGCNAALLMSK